jgi:hypothetical protein
VAMGVALILIALEILEYKKLLYFENIFSKKE